MKDKIIIIENINTRIVNAIRRAAIVKQTMTFMIKKKKKLQFMILIMMKNQNM